MNKTYIQRPLYTKKIEPYIGKDLIKVLVGQRRVGKSTILLQVKDHITELDPKAHSIYVNKELHEFDFIKTHSDLIKYVHDQSQGRKKQYVFLDEVQEIEEFQKGIRSLLAEGKYDLYCTGSNAKLLSSDLATLLSGRSIEIKVHSLSYDEFLTFHGLSENKEAFFKYLQYGGLPYLKNLILEDNIAYDYIRNVYNTILLKDVVKRFNIRNVAFLESLVAFLADNTGHLFSAKKISDFLKSQRINLSPNIVLDYIGYLSQAFLITRVPRFDIKGKKIFEINEKCYFEDLGLRHSVVGYKQSEITGVLENIVYNHLVMAGYRVTVGQLNSHEIDFVCERQGETIYVQVAYMITPENTEREFGNLLLIPDNHPKYVVSLDDMIGSTSQKGIKHISAVKFIRTLE